MEKQMCTSVIEIPPIVSHQYLIKGTTGYLLVDSGLSINYAHLLRTLRSSNISPKSIEMIVITHADGDHSGSLARLQVLLTSSLTSAASQIEAEAIRKGLSSRKLKPIFLLKPFYAITERLFSAPPAAIDQVLHIGDELPYLGGLTVLDSSGHTPGHLSLWSESTRILFCGDSIKIKGSLLSPSTGANTWDSEKARISFEKQIALHPHYIFAGHGTWHQT
jgi:glyoxylase-like metal-dependent hydrolase (beta-lactamase superfamily II)